MACPEYSFIFIFKVFLIFLKFLIFNDLVIRVSLQTRAHDRLVQLYLSYLSFKIPVSFGFKVIMKIIKNLK